MQLQVSFSQFAEDIILWNALSEIDSKSIFYIDAGANEAVNDSVTYLFYLLGGHGINIEPQIGYKAKYDAKRQRDINLFVGLGDKVGELKMYGEGQSATFDSNSEFASGAGRVVKIETLENICEKHVPDNQPIHFLKMDVEGFEKQCLEGMNFNKYRPWIICIEAQKPGSEEASHEEWEAILENSGYEYAFFYGVNRYYCDRTKKNIYDKLKNSEKIFEQYQIYKCYDYEYEYKDLLNSKSYKLVKPLNRLYTILRKGIKWKK